MSAVAVNPLFIQPHSRRWLPKRDRRVIVRRSHATAWQLDKSDAVFQADAYQVLKAWCLANGFSCSVLDLNHLYQEILMVCAAHARQGRFARIHLDALYPLIRSCKKNRSRSPAARMQLRNRQVRMLVASGLVQRRGRWLYPRCVSEAQFADPDGQNDPSKLAKCSSLNETRFANPNGQNASIGDLAPCVMRSLYRGLWAPCKSRAPRNRWQAQQRGLRGRFGAAQKEEKKSPKDTCASPAAQPPPKILPQVSLVEEKTLQEPPKGASVTQIQAYLAGLHEQEQKQARQCEARAAEAQERAPSNAPRGPCGTLQELLDVGYRPGFNTRHRLPERDLLAGLAKARRKYPGQNYLGSVLFNAAKEIHAGRWRSYRPKKSPPKTRFGTPRIVRRSELTGFSCDMPAPDGLPNDW